MSIILEMLQPYMLTTTSILVILVNFVLVFKGTPWLTIFIFNIVFSVTMNLIGFGSYDLLTQIAKYLGDFIIDIIKSIF